MQISELLNKPNTYLEWLEPWPGINPDGSETFGNVILRATVNDCIKMQRAATPLTHRQIENDYEILLDFIAVHLAKVIGKLE